MTNLTSAINADNPTTQITITIDPDIVNALKRAAGERNIGIDEALNNALRAGIGLPAKPRQPDRLKTYDMGAEPLGRWDKALQIAADLEDDEIVRKMETGK